MPDRLPDAVQNLQRKMLAGRLHGDPKRLAERQQIGRAFERALNIAGLTKQEAAALLGYDEQSQVSRWIAGVEALPFGRCWFGLGDAFQKAMLGQLARLVAAGVNVREVITIEERIA